MMSGVIRKGDFLIKVGDISVIGYDHKHTVERIQQAGRPITLTFRRIMSRKQEQARKARQRVLTGKHLVKKKKQAQRSIIAKEIAKEKARQEEIERAKQELQRLKRKQERKQERKRQRQIEREKLQEKAKEMNGLTLPKVNNNQPRCPICTLSFPCAHYKSNEDFIMKKKEEEEAKKNREKEMEEMNRINIALTSNGDDDDDNNNNEYNDDDDIISTTSSTIDVDIPLQRYGQRAYTPIQPKSFSINLETLQL